MNIAECIERDDWFLQNGKLYPLIINNARFVQIGFDRYGVQVMFIEILDMMFPNPSNDNDCDRFAFIDLDLGGPLYIPDDDPR